jgi:serine protease Do
VKNKNDNNKGKRKDSNWKNALIITLCSAFGLAYGLGILFIVYNVVNIDGTVKGRMEANSSSISSQYQDNKNTDVEVYVEIETQDDDLEEDTEPATVPIEEDIDDKANDKSDMVINRVQTVDETSDISLTVVTDVTEVVKTAMPSVVAITNEYTSYDSWYGQTDDEACGSGIIIGQTDQELLIVTNYHVIEDNNSLIITFIDDSEAEAYVKGVSTNDDLAVVSVALSDLGDETVDSIAIAVLGDSDALQVGEPAIAIGNSLGYGQSVTTGVISALNRNIDDACYIQTDAAINPGNSGGALLNIRGEVIGINSSKIADYVIEGMGYAIPISNAKPVIEELMLNETKKKVDQDNRGFLGISGTDVTEDAVSRYGMPAGVYVADVIEGSGAQGAGIKKGDIITTFDGADVESMTSLQGMLEYYEAGTKVEVVIMRQSNGEYNESTVTVTLGKREE